MRCACLDSYIRSRVAAPTASCLWHAPAPCRRVPDVHARVDVRGSARLGGATRTGSVVLPPPAAEADAAVHELGFATMTSFYA
eukprot:85401-Heterocapsa_arctica.AAC.1